MAKATNTEIVMADLASIHCALRDAVENRDLGCLPIENGEPATIGDGSR